MLYGIFTALSIDPKSKISENKEAVHQKIDRRVVNEMANSIGETFMEVYRTAATEMGFMKRSDGTRTIPENFQSKNSSACDKSQLPSGCNGSSLTANTVFEASRRGLLAVVEEFVQKEGVDVLQRFDESGHTAAHYAALTGQAHILRFIVEHGGAYQEPSQHELGQQPIHWACVNGHVVCIDILLQAGVPVDLTDRKGCTPLIIAAQYGQTVTAGYLMGRGARLQICDAEGDNALHWAAFKGASDLMRLLVYSGFNPNQKDNFGQTVLHLACISGNLAAVRDLALVDKVQLNVADKNGKTPLMLAAGRRHDEIERFLTQEIRVRSSVMSRINWQTLMFGPPGNSRFPMLFFVLNIAFWGYPMYIFKCLPMTYHLFPWLHYVFVILNIGMWVCLYHANHTDPGFLPRNIPAYDLAIKQVACQNEFPEKIEDHPFYRENSLARLCHTCRTVKPLRAKHCRVCNRCVLEMDHHCPYIYNCVGLRNRIWFNWFVTIGNVMLLCTIRFAVAMLWEGGCDVLVVLGLLCTLLGSIILIFTSSCVWYHAMVNLTTNESMNRKRYKYLKDGRGNFRNPFDRGVISNLLEYFHFKTALTLNEDTVSV